MPMVAVWVASLSWRPFGNTESSAPVTILNPDSSGDPAPGLSSVTLLSPRRMNELSPTT
jgi:hypothetical protein